MDFTGEQKMNLKTLKEIELPSDGCNCENILRQEAIKWIKSDKSNFYSEEGMEDTKLWIKYFFNLEESDLK